MSAVLAACSPSYDWRTLHNDAGYTIDLPAKPTVEEQPVAIGGASMPMRMQAAHVDGAVFAVGTLTLPDDRDDTSRAALEFLRAGLSRNLEGAPQTASVPVPLAAGGAVNGLELRVAGAAAGGDRAHKTIVARLVARGRHAYRYRRDRRRPAHAGAARPVFRVVQTRLTAAGEGAQTLCDN